MDKIKKLSLGLVAILLVGLASLSGCLAPTGTTPSTGSGTGGFDWTIIVFLVVIFALMWFTMIRPQRKRQKEHEKLISELRNGDRVITAGGIFGVIDSVAEDSIVIKVESGALLRVARGSVVVKKD